MGNVLNEFASWLNTYASDKDDFAEEMVQLHPTLQQKLMRFFIAWCRKMTKLHNDDPRNKASVELARKIIDMVDEEYIRLPQI